MATGPSDSDRLQRELTFRTALVSLTNELLASQLDSTFYQTALERTVDLVPAADGGSVLARHEHGRYYFEAADHVSGAFDFSGSQYRCRDLPG